MIAYRNPLSELTQFRLLQDLRQFRLARQDNLDQFVRLGFQVGDQPDLLQDQRFQVLRLVDNQHHGTSCMVLGEQEAVEGIQQFRAVQPFPGDPEFPVDAAQKFRGGKARIEDQGAAKSCIVELAEQCPQDGGLAGPHFTGKGDETGMVVDAVDEMGKGLLMVFAQENEAGVGRNLRQPARRARRARGRFHPRHHGLKRGIG